MFRRLLFTTLVVGLSIPVTLALLWAIEGSPSAAGQERKNCPPGFVWIRMSGIGCVQEKLPANAKISYEGYSICEDGYTGIYERRATTDGEPAPGTPYTSFAYLKRCEKSGAGSGGGIAGGGGGITRDAAKRLYDDGYGPLPGDLAGAGGLVAGAATLAAAGGWIARGWGAGAQASSARMAELAKRLAELDREIAKAHKEDQEARKVIEEMTEKSKPWKERLDGLLKLYNKMGGGLMSLESRASWSSFGEWCTFIGAVLAGIATLPAFFTVSAAWGTAGGAAGLGATFTPGLHRITGQPTSADWDKLAALTKKAMQRVHKLTDLASKEYLKLQERLWKAQNQSHDARERLWRLQEERKDVYQQYKWAQGDERSRRFQQWLKSSR
jgi:hypothetical protein